MTGRQAGIHQQSEHDWPFSNCKSSGYYSAPEGVLCSEFSRIHTIVDYSTAIFGFWPFVFLRTVLFTIKRSINCCWILNWYIRYGRRMSQLNLNTTRLGFYTNENKLTQLLFSQFGTQISERDYDKSTSEWSIYCIFWIFQFALHQRAINDHQIDIINYVSFVQNNITLSHVGQRQQCCFDGTVISIGDLKPIDWQSLRRRCNF